MYLCVFGNFAFNEIEFEFKIRSFALFSSYLILRCPFTSYLVDPACRRGAPYLYNKKKEKKKYKT